MCKRQNKHNNQQFAINLATSQYSISINLVIIIQFDIHLPTSSTFILIFNWRYIIHSIVIPPRKKQSLEDLAPINTINAFFNSLFNTNTFNITGKDEFIDLHPL